MDYNNIFNQDFYPTPENVLDMMELDINNKTVYEPSAGKGDILKYCKKWGAKKILYSEINKELAYICSSISGVEQIGTDFFSVNEENISHVNMIIMNPPFSNWTKHILHAWNIAPEGCEIVSLCNNDSYELKRNQELFSLIENYGYSNYLGDVFNSANSERKTKVEISVIKLFKPVLSGSINFDKYYDSFDFDLDIESFNQYSLVSYNEIDSIINSYKSILKNIDVLYESIDQFKKLMYILDIEVDVKFDFSYNDNIKSKQQFLNKIQLIFWKRIFAKLNMEKYLTSGVISDLNKFIANRTQTPFTKRNIFSVIEIIIGTKDENFKKALCEAVDNFTKHTFENRWNVEGWKTNSGHMLNKKFIVNYMVRNHYSYSNKLVLNYSNNADQIRDLLKVLCNITGTDFNIFSGLDCFITSLNGLTPNQWYDWSFFEIKAFKKGTMHFKFQNEKDWILLNKEYAKIKGFALPENIK